MDFDTIYTLTVPQLTHVLTNIKNPSDFEEVAIEIIESYAQKTKHTTQVYVFTNKHFEEHQAFVDNHYDLTYIKTTNELTNRMYYFKGILQERFNLLIKTEYSCLNDFNETNKLDFPSIYIVIDDLKDMKDKATLEVMLFSVCRSLPVNINYIVNDTSGNLEKENEELYSNLIAHLTIENDKVVIK